MKYETLQEIVPHLQTMQRTVDAIYNIIANAIETGEIIPPETEEETQKTQTKTEKK